MNKHMVVRVLEMVSAVLAPLAASAGTLESTVVADSSLEALLASLPDKSEDVMTVTKRFRRDLVDFCRVRGCGNLTAVEVGCHLGHTSAVLSRLFGRVFVLDNSGTNLAAARSRCVGGNVVYLRVENYNGLQRFEWAAMLAGNDVHVALVDASHRYDHVAADIQSALSLRTLEMLIFDDYGLIAPVREAVDAYVESGRIRCEPIGEEVRTLRRTDAVREVEQFWGPGGDHREGQLCAVVAHGPRPVWERALLGLHFGCYADSVLEVSFQILPGVLRLSWPPGAGERKTEVGYDSVPGHRLLLHEDVPPLARELMFGERLRTGFFLRDGGTPQLCVALEDLQRVAEWTRDDVLQALHWQD